MKGRYTKTIRTLSTIILTAILALSSFSLPVNAADTKVTPSGVRFDDIREEIEKLAGQTVYSSFETAVFCDKDILYTGYFGEADIENGLAADSNTVYEWGSITKTLTWVSVMQLYEQGKLELDRDVRDYLPKDFFKKLRYDEPITMLDLMNHQGGWSENTYTIMVDDENDIMQLEDALQYSEPRQVFRPGEITSYSNWGAALAGYIVERVSGMPFSEYVKTNIFKPLGMEHTSIAPDYRDNMWVRQQREKLKSYTVKGSDATTTAPLGTNMWYINLYPAGSATGTIGDLTLYAQALVSDDSPLFQSRETMDFMFSGSSFYGQSDIKRSCHGFFAEQFAVETVGHPGSTFSCSSRLVLDRESSIGVVMMCNQPSECSLMNTIPALIYGDISDNQAFQKTDNNSQNDIDGLYTYARNYYADMFKFFNIFNIMPISQVSKDEYTITNSIGISRFRDDLYIMSDKGGKYPVAMDTVESNKRVLHINLYDSIDNDRVFYLEYGIGCVFLVITFIGTISLAVRLIRILLKKEKGHSGTIMIDISDAAKIVSVVLLITLYSLWIRSFGITHTQGLLFCIVQLLCTLVYAASAIHSFVILLHKDRQNDKSVRHIMNILFNGISIAFALVFELCCF